jgi:CubicO group peptidase (beta-lactamase class C family)
MANQLMMDFPPPEEMRVTLANWRKPPFNKWSFQHVRELIPTADILNDPNNIGALAGLSIKAEDGGAYDLADFLRATDTDEFVVIRDGEIVHEVYDNGMGPDTPHIFMSVSKSVLGLLAGILVDRGALEFDAAVTRWIPEIERTAYAGATVRDLLDMRAGVLFDED